MRGTNLVFIYASLYVTDGVKDSCRLCWCVPVPGEASPGRHRGRQSLHGTGNALGSCWWGGRLPVREIKLWGEPQHTKAANCGTTGPVLLWLSQRGLAARRRPAFLPCAPASFPACPWAGRLLAATASGSAAPRARPSPQCSRAQPWPAALPGSPLAAAAAVFGALPRCAGAGLPPPSALHRAHGRCAPTLRTRSAPGLRPWPRQPVPRRRKEHAARCCSEIAPGPGATQPTAVRSMQLSLLG